jgi:hypothetical protein
VQPKATAPHLGSTRLGSSDEFAKSLLYPA